MIDTAILDQRTADHLIAIDVFTQARSVGHNVLRFRPLQSPTSIRPQLAIDGPVDWWGRTCWPHPARRHDPITAPPDGPDRPGQPGTVHGEQLGTSGYNGVHRDTPEYSGNSGKAGYSGVQQGAPRYTWVHRVHQGTPRYGGVHRGTPGYIAHRGTLGYMVGRGTGYFGLQSTKPWVREAGRQSARCVGAVVS